MEWFEVAVLVFERFFFVRAVDALVLVVFGLLLDAIGMFSNLVYWSAGQI
ncbi:MAG: hypothetical protein PVJ39_15360 [Gammaproteobacteria bacterium]|jgi:hypothetical protein